MGKSAGKLPKVVFFQRRPRAVGNYSLEFIFDDVRKRLSGKIESVTAISRYESSGLFKRLYILFEAIFRQGDVNHVTGDISFVGILLKKKRTIQTVLDCVHLNNTTGLKYRVLKLFWLSLPEKRARFLTAISESTKREILRHHRCDPEKIVVIPVAISPGFSFEAKTFNKQKPVILQLGTAPNKNLPSLIKAIEGISCHLHIVGKKEEQYEQLLNASNISYTYEWGLPAEEVINRYKSADIISLVSTYEGFGMPILEGQATGRPVITSNVFSMPEVAGDAAVLVNPEDINAIREGLLRIIHDDPFREQLVERGRENVKRFDPDFIAGQYLDVYKRIVNSDQR